jgi:hypothetical protein
MTSAYRTIQFEGQVYSEDTLHEEIWQLNREIRCGLSKRERIDAKRQIAQYEELLTALRSAGA